MPDVAGLGIEVDSRQVKEATKDLTKLEKAGGKTEKATDRLKASTSSLSGVYKKLAGSMALLATGKMISDVVKLADKYTLLNNKLKLVTTSEENLTAVQKQLYQLTLETHGVYSDTVTLYSRFARATEEMGISQGDLLVVTKALNEAILVSGASSTEANAALTQLGQGMASGVLRGEELNSVLEQTPRIARMIADGMGITIGQLRAYGQAGKLTSEEVINAIKGQAAVVSDEFDQMSVTVGQAWQDVKTVFQGIIVDGAEAGSVTETLSEALQELAEYLDNHKDDIRAFFVNGVEGAQNFSRVALPILGEIWEGIEDIIDGYNALPDTVKQLGIILAVVGGKKGLAALAALSAASAAGKKLSDITLELMGIQVQTADAIITTGGTLDDYVSKLGDTSVSATELKSHFEDINSAMTDTGKAAGKSAEDQCKANKTALTCLQKKAKEAEKLAEAEAKEVEELHDTYIESAEGVTSNWEIQAAERDDVMRRSLQMQGQMAEEAAQEEIDAQKAATAQIIEFRKGMTNDMAAIFDEYLTGVLTGQVESFQDLFEGLFDAILDMFIRMISQMVAEWAAAGIMGMITGEGLEGFGVAGGSGLSSLMSGASAVSTASGMAGGPTLGSAATSIGSYFGIGGGTTAVAPYVAGGGQALGSAGISTAVAEGVATGMTATAQFGGAGMSAFPTSGSVAAGYGATGGASSGSTAGASAGVGAAAAPVAMAAAVAITAIIGNLTPSVSMFETTIKSFSGSTLKLVDFALDLEEAAANFSDPAWIQSQVGVVAQHGTNVLSQSAYTEDYGIVQTSMGNDVAGAYAALQVDTHQMSAETEGGGEMAAGVEAIADSLYNKLHDVYTALKIESEQYGDSLATIALSMGDSLGHFDNYVDAVAGVDVSMDASASMMDLASQAAQGNASAHSQLMDALMAQGLSADQATAAAAQMAAVLYEGSTAVDSMAGAVQAFSDTDLNLEATARLNVEVEGDADVSGSVDGSFSTSSSSRYSVSDSGGPMGGVSENAEGGVFLNTAMFRPGQTIAERGAEAAIPLHDGPDTLKKMHEDILSKNNNPVNVQVYIGDKEIKKDITVMVDSHLVARNKRGLTTERAVY